MMLMHGTYLCLRKSSSASSQRMGGALYSLGFIAGIECRGVMVPNGPVGNKPSVEMLSRLQSFRRVALVNDVKHDLAWECLS